MLHYKRGIKQVYVRLGDHPNIPVEAGSTFDETTLPAAIVERLLSTGDFELVSDNAPAATVAAATEPIADDSKKEKKSKKGTDTGGNDQ